MRAMILPRRGFLTAALVLASAAAGCSGDKKPAPGAARPRVAVSIFPLFDLARRIAGDRLDAALVLPPGRSEHDYDPTPKEVALLSESKLVVAVGLAMDEWLTGVVRKSASGSLEILELGPKLEPVPIAMEHVGEEEAEAAGKKDGHEDEHEHEKGALDPHVWLDPVRMTKAVDLLVEAFVKIDAQGAEAIKGRGATVKGEIQKLHEQIEAKSKAWTKKNIVTFHGSMNYFAARYGLKIAAVIEPFPGREPTPKYVEAVLKAVKETGAAALFSEPQLDRRPAQVIADEAKLPLFELDPVGGTPGADSYEKLMLRNADVLDKALK